jgi:hypothetical protein
VLSKTVSCLECTKEQAADQWWQTVVSSPQKHILSALCSLAATQRRARVAAAIKERVEISQRSPSVVCVT